MKKIYALTDYNNNFGSKWKSTPYRSGYDKSLLKLYFNKYGYDIEYTPLCDVKFDEKFWENKPVIYTSAEYFGLEYKDYIEDIVYGLEMLGANVVPKPCYLKATNNKVFMEILQKIVIKNPLDSMWFGSYEELEFAIQGDKIKLPCVLKTAESRMSRGVLSAHSKEELLRNAKKISRSFYLKPEIIEFLRSIKYKNYQKKSKYQNKFIIQPLIQGLKNDWKVLIYWDRIYVLKRGVKVGDFRASGSGVDYKAGGESGFTLKLLKFVYNYFLQLDVPNVSIDVGSINGEGVIFEIQALYYGTSTQYKSKDFYQKEGDDFVLKEKDFDQEEDYAYSIVKYLESKE